MDRMALPNIKVFFSSLVRQHLKTGPCFSRPQNRTHSF